MDCSVLFTTIKVDSWDGYKTFVNRLSENWVFRGQVNAEWILRNAIERTEFIHFQSGIEKAFLTEFMRGARNYLNRNEIPEHLIEWLALMQHHGAPTRLLDFTKSPFISSFFAFEQDFGDIDCVAVWAINFQHLRQAAANYLRPFFENEFRESNDHFNESIFEKIFNENRHSVVFPVEPFRMNKRYSLQQSTFISSGNSREPFIDQLAFLNHDITRTVIRIDIPVSEKKQAIRDLQKMNITRASLFPDLDGYASGLRVKYNNMHTPQETEDHLTRLSNDEKFNLIP